MGKRELVALLNLSSWCLLMVEWLFLAVPWGCLRLEKSVLKAFQQLLYNRHLINAEDEKISHTFIVSQKCSYRLISSKYQMFLIIYNVLYAACCHGNNYAITPTTAHNEGWATLNLQSMNSFNLSCIYIITYLTHAYTLYLSDVYNESSITNKQLKTSTLTSSLV